MQSESDKERPKPYWRHVMHITYHPLSLEDKLSDFVVYKEFINMKKTKVIIPALGILLLSTAASVTGTVAWFTAANDVDVSGMQFTAQSEQAIVVSNEGKTSWVNSGVTASHNGAGKTFLTTSTKDFTTWYHAYSNDANNGQATVDRVTLAVTKPTAGTGDANTGLGVVTGATKADSSADDSFNNQNVYLLNRFYVQSATQVALSAQDLYVKNLSVTSDSALVNAALDASIRVGFVFSDTNFIFAPVEGATAQYNVNGSSTNYDVKAITDTSAGEVISGAAGISIPAYTANGANALPIDVYIWFEGEDANNKSANVLGSMDTLKINFKLGNKAHVANDNSGNGGN